MSRARSYAVLAGQLLLLVGAGVLLVLVLQALGVSSSAATRVVAPLGAVLVVGFLATRRLTGAQPDAALAGFPVLLPVDRWRVGGIWQNKLRRTTRAGWAPGVLGLAPGRAVFVPSRPKEADRRWEDSVRAVQLRGVLMGSATALRVHGRRGTVQFSAQRSEKEVRADVESVLPVTGGWDESLPGPPPEQPVAGQRAWPQQYSVRLLLEDGSETRVEVGTWQDERAAERIARRVHGAGVREAVVVDMGPVPRRPDGLPDISELAVDRQEF